MESRACETLLESPLGLVPEVERLLDDHDTVSDRVTTLLEEFCDLEPIQIIFEKEKCEMSIFDVDAFCTNLLNNARECGC